MFDFFLIVQLKFFHSPAASPLQHGTVGACGLAPMKKFQLESPFGLACSTRRKMRNYRKNPSTAGRN